MSGSLKVALLILAIAVNILGSCANPCDEDEKPGKPTKCERLNGYCYHPECRDCEGHIRTDLCRGKRHQKEKKLCCLPGPPKTDACCEFEGDPHIITYDNKGYDVQVEGTFIISRPCESEHFLIKAVFQKPYVWAGWTLVVEVIVEVGGNTVIIYSNGAVTINGVAQTLPHQVPGTSMVVYNVPPIIYVNIQNINVFVSFNAYTKQLIVCVNKKFMEKLCGLCGNYNGDPTDDVTVKGRADEGCPRPRSHDDWKQCEDELTTILSECPNVPIERYLEFCAFDMCAEEKLGAWYTLEAAKEKCKSEIYKMNQGV